LRTAYAGGCRRTRKSWLLKFFFEIQESAESGSPGIGQPRVAHSAPSSSARARHEEAERELAASGI
jgi:hypothetical protein